MSKSVAATKAKAGTSELPKLEAGPLAIPALEAEKPATAVAPAPAAKKTTATAVKVPAKKLSAATVKPGPVKKPKLVRDSFTFPENEYALLAVLKERALQAGCTIKKSELLRAGLLALQAMPDTKLLDVLNTVERIKTGRPAK